MKPGQKLREGRVALGEVKGKVEALLQEKEYAKVVEEIEALSKKYTPEEKDVEWAELQVRLSFAKEKLGRYDKETAEAAYEVLKLTDRHKEIGTIERILGKVYLALGETKTALRYLRNSLSVFDRMEDEKGKIDTLNALGRACFFISSRTQEAIEHLSEALKLCKEGVDKGDKSQRAMVLGNLGTVYRRVGQWPLASKMLRSSLKLYEELNYTLEISRGLTTLARLLIMQRSFAKAEELLNRAEVLSQDYPRELAMVYESVGWLEIGLFEREGNSHHLEIAEQWLLKALQIGQRIAPEGDIICEVSEKLGWVCLGFDRLEGALGYAERSLRIARRLGSAYDQGLAHRLLGTVYQRKGERRKARDHFAQSVSLLEGIQALYDLALSLFYSGRFLIEGTKPRSEGVNELAKSRDIFQSLKLSYWEGRSWIEEARGEILGGDLDKATESLTQASDILKKAGEGQALKGAIQVKDELDRALAQASLEAREEQSLLERLEQVSSQDLGELLEAVARRTSAQRAFIGFSGNMELQLRGYWGMEEEQARELLEKVCSLNEDVLKPRRPIFSSLASEDERFPFLRGKKVSSLMIVPFGLNSKVEGILYMDRVSGRPFRQRDLNFFVLSAGILQVKVVEFQKEELEEEVRSLKERLGEGEVIITRNERMGKVLDIIERLKGISPFVLIEGESGTGKELIARLIYRNSPRRDKPFIPINCASIPDTLLESELFGYEKGAFTDARALHRGIFEVADGGTVFLDEIGDLSLSLQPKILRVLENQTFRRVGGTEEIRVDVRVIVATSKDLGQEIKAGHFRKELFYRLNRMRIKLPSLRERQEDILPLTQHYLEHYSREYKGKARGISSEALSLLLAYRWPGNIRELMSVVEKGVILARGDLITPELLPEEIRGQRPRPSEEMWNLRELPQGSSFQEVLKKLERQMTEEVLRRCKGNRTKAARVLGITREGLVRRLKRYQTTGRRK